MVGGGILQIGFGVVGRNAAFAGPFWHGQSCTYPGLANRRFDGMSTCEIEISSALPPCWDFFAVTYPKLCEEAETSRASSFLLARCGLCR